MQKTTRLLTIVGLLTFFIIGGIVAQEGDSLGYGETASGVISDEVPEVTFTFEGSQGNVITITMVGLNPENPSDPRLDSYLTLIGPEGNTLFQDDDGAGNLNSLIGPYTLPGDGTYTIIASRFLAADGTSLGAFEVTLNITEVNELVIGEPLTAELPNSASDVFFSYTSAGGEIMEISANVPDSSGVYTIVIENEAGEWVNQGYSQPNGELFQGPVFISDAGNYTFTVSREPEYDNQGQIIESDASLTVVFTVQAVQDSPIALDETVSGTLNDENPVVYYTFTAEQGQSLSLALNETSEGQPVDTEVYGPEGFSIAGGSTSFTNTPGMLVVDPILTNQSGQYVLAIRRSVLGPEGNAGTVSAYEATISGTQLPGLELGVEITDSIDPNSNTFEKVYRYAGTAGEVIQVTLRSVNDIYGPSMNIQGPSLNNDPFIMNASSARPSLLTYEIALEADGEYIFRINNGFFGDYQGEIPTFGLMVESVESAG